MIFWSEMILGQTLKPNTPQFWSAPGASRFAHLGSSSMVPSKSSSSRVHGLVFGFGFKGAMSGHRCAFATEPGGNFTVGRLAQPAVFLHSPAILLSLGAGSAATLPTLRRLCRGASLNLRRPVQTLAWDCSEYTLDLPSNYPHFFLGSEQNQGRRKVVPRYFLGTS
jgi:hypothetical protein